MEIKKQTNGKDMYLPKWLLIFGILLISIAIYLIVNLARNGYSNPYQNAGALIGAFVTALLGTAAILCWKNQRITIISDSLFEYSTMFGRKTEYSFSQITALKQNADSITLFVDGNQKIHIESCAVLSERLVKKIDAALPKVNE